MKRLSWSQINLSSLKLRILSAVVFSCVVLIFLFVLDHRFTFALLSLLWLVLGYETAKLLYQRHFVITFLISILLLVLAAGLLLLMWSSYLVTIMLLGIASLWWIAQLKWLAKPMPETKTDLGWVSKPVYMLFSISLSAAALCLLLLTTGPQSVLFLIVIIAASDIGAFFGGRAFPHTLLIAHVSPKKTTSGLCIGMLIGLIPVFLFAFALDYWCTYAILAFGIVLIGIGVIGDLCASKIKRLAKVKDSGRILPGHGGLLDRMDSIIAALPFFTLVILLASS